MLRYILVNLPNENRYLHESIIFLIFTYFTCQFDDHLAFSVYLKCQNLLQFVQDGGYIGLHDEDLPFDPVVVFGEIVWSNCENNTSS